MSEPIRGPRPACNAYARICTSNVGDQSTTGSTSALHTHPFRPQVTFSLWALAFQVVALPLCAAGCATPRFRGRILVEKQCPKMPTTCTCMSHNQHAHTITRPKPPQSKPARSKPPRSAHQTPQAITQLHDSRSCTCHPLVCTLTLPKSRAQTADQRLHDKQEQERAPITAACTCMDASERNTVPHNSLPHITP